MKQVGWGILLLLIGGVIGYFLRVPEVERVEVPGPIKLVPKIIYQDTGSVKVVEVPAKVDTQAVITDYYTKRPIMFQDTVQEVALRFDGVLFENRLIAPELTLHNFRQPVKPVNLALWGDVEGGFNSFRVGASLERGPNRIGANYDLIQGTWNLKYSRRIWIIK